MKLLREGKSFSGREKNCAFLNCSDSRFANVSAVSGLDFPDDGRAVASVDWDHDGDLDLWIHNRTGPRLRFMRNQTCDAEPNVGETDRTNFVSFHLQGVQCNRDAIGAKVTVRTLAEPLVQSLRAGDGYLSQSSKWLHFGLGQDAKIEGITVRWPDGKQEEFPAVRAGHRYRLVEGTGVVLEVADRGAVRLAAQPQKSTDPSASIRATIATPVPLPILEMRSQTTQEPQVVRAEGRPLVVVLWASWCPNCIEELTEFAARQADFERIGLDVLAVNVDSLGNASPHDEDAAEDVLRRIDFPYANGYGTPELMDKLQIVQRVVLNRPLETAVPTILLVNRNEELTAIYQGVQSVDTLLEDASKSRESIVARRDLAVPFPGTWITPPDVLLMRPVANVFREAGYRPDYEHYLKLDRKRLARLQSDVASDSRRDLEVRFANDSLDIALSLLESGRAMESLDYFREGLQYVPDSASGHFHFGRGLRASNQREAAIEEFRAALKLDETFYKASFELGVISAAANQLGEAADHFRNVVDLQPTHVDAWANLGAVLARMKRSDESMVALKRAARLDSNNAQAWLALGGQLAGRGDFGAASSCFRKVTALKPGFAQGHAALGQSLVKLKQDVDASAALQRAISLNRRDHGSKLQLAWLQSTSPIESVRNGAAALRVAEILAKQTGNRDPRVLDVMGAALAETGDFDRAIEFTQMAIELISSKHPLRPILQARVDGYTNGQPFRAE